MRKITDYTLLSSVQATKVDDTGKPTSDDDEACFGITLDDVLKYGHLLIPAEELKYYELEKWFMDEAVPAVIEGGGYFLPINRVIGKEGWIQLNAASKVGITV